MQGTIKLENPIMINGESISELKYDFSKITVEDYGNAEAAKARALGSNGAMIQKVAQLDSTLHLYLAIAAIIAVNRSYTYLDLSKISGFDVTKLMKAGQAFFTGQRVEASEEKSSENSHENTQNITTSL